MSRYVNQLNTPVDTHSFSNVISDYMISEGFKIVDYKGAKVWKKGTGWLTAPQYICFTYGPNFIRIEAFIRNVFLPGVYFGEMGLDGFYGWAVKDLLKTRVKKVENYVISLWNQPNPDVPPQADQ